jgi:tetratricopeptide (TPR) repeat protein
MIEVVRERYTKNGKFDDAERMYLLALETYELFLPAQQKEMADLAYNLANSYTLRGRFEKAEPMATKALRAYEESLGPDHHYTLDALANLANILNQQGKETEAERIHLQALERREKSLGPEHRKTLESVFNVGAFYFSQNKLKEAELFFIRALAGFRKALGEKHSVTLGVLINMSTLYREQRRRQDAARSLLLALDGYESAILEFQDTSQASQEQPMMERNPGRVIFVQYSNAANKGDLSAFLPSFRAALDSLESLAGTYVKEKDSVGAEDLFWRLIKAKTLVGSPIDETSHLLSVILLQRCMMEITGAEPVALETTSTDWPDPNPVWRLVHLVETYRSDEVFNILCKTLMRIGDERVRAGLQRKATLSIEHSQSSGRACDRCQTDITLETGWYVCRSCLKDTELCEPCFTSQLAGWELHPCVKHSFYAVFAADLEDVDAFGDLASWLEDVKASYATGYEAEISALGKQSPESADQGRASWFRRVVSRCRRPWKRGELTS